MDEKKADATAREDYRDYVRKRLEDIAPILEKVSLGEFDQSIPIPAAEEDEFTELFVGLNLMIEDLKFMFQENQEKTTELERRLTELSVFNEVGRALGSTLKLDELLEVIYAQTSRVMDTASFYIALLDEKSNMIEFPLFIDDGNRISVPPKEFGNGLTEYIIKTRKPLLIRENVEKISGELGIDTLIEGEPAQCWLGVPMISQDSVVGVIAVQSIQQAGIYDEDHQRLLEAIANAAAGAVANARSYAELERRLTELSVFNKVGRAVGSTLKLEEQLKIIYEQARRVMPADHFYVALYHRADEEEAADEEVEFVLYIQDGKEALPRTRNFSNGLTEYVIRAREPLLIERDLPNRIKELRLNVEIHGTPAKSWLGVPLMARDEVIGVMAAQSVDREDAYDEGNKAFLVSLASQASGAIDNSRTYRELEERLTELSVINEISRTISSTLNIEELFGVVYEQIKRLLDSDNFYIALYDPKQEEVTFPYIMDGGARIPGGKDEWATRRQGHGITEYVIKTAKPQLISGDSKAELAKMEVNHIGMTTRSWIGAPMMARGEVIGVVALQSFQDEIKYTRKHTRLLQLIANQAAPAVANARAYRELEDRVTELSVLNEISRAVSSTLDINVLFEQVHKQTKRVMYADNLYIALYDPQRDEVSFPYVFEDGGKQVSGEGEWVTRRSGKGLTEHVIKTAKPQQVFRSIDIGGVNDIGRPSEAWLGVPMIARNQVIGVIAVQSFDSSLIYSDKDMRLLQMIANQAAPAVENARAYRELENRVTELSVVNEISRTISSTLDVAELYSVVHTQIKRLMNADDFYIALYDATSDEVSFPYAYQDGEVQKWRSRAGGKGMTEYVIKTAKPQLFSGNSEVETAKRGVDHIGKASLSWIGVPMIVGSEVIGVMTVQSFDPAISYAEKHMRLLQMVANQAAPAIENARAYSLMERRVEERTAELARSNESLEDFVYTVSHDLKAPLRAILGFSQFLVEDFARELPDEGKLYLERMSTSARRMERLIDDLLELSRVGRFKNPYEETDIEELLSETVATLSPGKNVSVRVEGPMSRITCERVRIGQVFANLISNAIKYNDKEKTEIIIGNKDLGEEAEFFVSDNGPGIEEKHFEKIFKIFQRLSSDEGGTGIGLALVKKIVEDHKGRIWVESELGKGTSFRFVLPKKPEMSLEEMPTEAGKEEIKTSEEDK
ncbi:GAF domain-containing protein [candidate division WOR-3 bacterium]|nr:GAF domain-containing protein [candidate division WOR-3 bacterium]